jgi:6-phosphogluconolactonase (cycloisomerase 2 family)
MTLRRAAAAPAIGAVFLLCSCGGSGGGGDGGAGTATNVPRYALVANLKNNSVSTYVVDAASGRLKYIGKAATGSGPSSVAFDPSSKYAYVANSLSDNVSQYTIRADGTLAPMGRSFPGPCT